MSAAPVGRRRVELVVILGALTAFAPLSIDMYLPAFPRLAEDFATGPGPVQWTLSSFFLAFAGGQAAWGPLADRYGRRRPLYAALGLYVLASAGCMAAPDVWSLVGLRFVQGLGAAAGPVIARAVVRDLFAGDEAARVYSALILVMGLAPMLAPLGGAWLLTAADWPAIFLALAATGLAVLAAVAMRMPETHRRDDVRTLHPGTILATYRALALDRRFMVWALTGACALGGLFAYIAGAPFVFIELYGLSPDGFAMLFGAIAVGFVGAAQVNGRLVGRVGARAMLSAGLMVQCLAALALVGVAATGWGSVWAFSVPLFIAIAALGLVLPNTSALAMTPFPRMAGSASALMGTIQFAVAAATAALMGAIEAESALPVAVMIAGGAFVAAGIRWRQAPRHDKPGRPQP